jgi:excisionase family DNA binding protein
VKAMTKRAPEPGLSKRSTLSLLTLAEVAAALHVSVRTVRRLIDDKRLRTHRILRQLRISDADLAAFIRSSRED